MAGTLTGVVLELKVPAEGQSVEAALAETLKQIERKRYHTQLEAAHATPIVEMAVVYDNRRAHVRVAQKSSTEDPNNS